MRSALWIITIANLLNYLDRYIISSVAPKIQEEFGLSHAQTGLLMSAFMIGYVVTCPIFGWLGDRWHRPRLMGIGVFLWSLATGMSGYVSSFFLLLLSRVGVGVGEASYATISPAYIRDRLQDDLKVNRAMSLFYLAIPIGAAMGYMFGGYMAHHYNWRWAFYLGAIPGFVLTFFIISMIEVPRGQSTQNSVKLADSIKSLWSNRLYRYIVIGYTAHTFGLGGFAAWAPHYSSKFLGVSLAEASFKIGAITCIAGVVGTLIGGRWGSFFIGKQVKSNVNSASGFTKFAAITSLVATPFALWTIHTVSLNQFMVAMLLVQIALFASIAPINTATLSAVSPAISATAFAVQIFTIHALGDVISPPLVGWMSDRMPMNSAMNVLVFSIFLSGVIWWIVGIRFNKKEMLQHGANTL